MKKIKKLSWQAFYEPEWCEYKPEFTGLPVSIWVDVSGYKRRCHLDYIRFAWWAYDPAIPNLYPNISDTNPMLICDDPYEAVEKIKINKTDDSILLPVTAFVKKHQKLLKDVGCGKIGWFTFEELLKQAIESGQ